MNKLPTVQPVRDVKTLKAIGDAAREDDHYVISPTHVIMKDGEVAGYWSINGIPHVHLWHNSKTISARDSYWLTHMLDHTIRNAGHDKYAIYCADTSPYFNHMDRGGFRLLFNSNLFFKET